MPKTLEELSIPENLLKYGDEEHLYHWDSGTQDDNQILIFSTKVTSEWFCKDGGVLLADGTFSVIPQLFDQLYMFRSMEFQWLACLYLRKIADRTRIRQFSIKSIKSSLHLILV